MGPTLPIGKTEPRLFGVPNARRRRTVPLRARPGRRPRTTRAFDPRKSGFVPSKPVQTTRAKHPMHLRVCYTAVNTTQGIRKASYEHIFVSYARRHAPRRARSLRHAEIVGNPAVKSRQNGLAKRSTRFGRRRQSEKSGFSEIYPPNVSLPYFLAFLLGVPSPP